MTSAITKKQQAALKPNPEKWRPSSLGAHSECGLSGLADGMADSVDRLTASGNGQIPIVAATAWKLLA